MTISFRIATAADDVDGPVAEISTAQLADFCSLLRGEGRRLATSLIDLDDDNESPPTWGFEVRVCPVSLATLAATFEFDPQVIAVLDEAQFRARRVSIWRVGAEGPYRMRPSITSDLAVELNLANGNAYALLESLGLSADSVGEAPIEEVRERLANPAIRRRMAAHNVTHYADPLERLLASAGMDERSRFEWA